MGGARTDRYVSGAMQNELLKTIAMRAIRSVAQSFQQTAFATVMMDETANVANVVQVVLFSSS